MEIGILVRIYQAGLINESMFVKVIENVSKKDLVSIIVFCNKRHDKNSFLKKQ